MDAQGSAFRFLLFFFLGSGSVTFSVSWEQGSGPAPSSHTPGGHTRVKYSWAAFRTWYTMALACVVPSSSSSVANSWMLLFCSPGGNSIEAIAPQRWRATDWDAEETHKATELALHE